MTLSTVTYIIILQCLQKELTLLQDTAPNLVEITEIGKSYYNKTIVSVKITNEFRNYNKTPSLIVSHHHAREQITVEIAVRLMFYLINNYETDEAVTNLLDTYDIYILPTINPDGLDQVVNFEDYWLRKNLKPFDDDNDGLFDEDHMEDTNDDGVISGFEVYDRINNNWVYNYTYYEGIDNDGDGLINEDMRGYVDLNRNYPSFFKDGTSWSEDTQSPVYPGEAPFSEIETQVYRDFALNHKFAFAYSLHSGINATFFPGNAHGGWMEPQLYTEIINEMAVILPPSFNDFGTLSQHVHSAVAGTWDNWMYDRGTIVPITLEIFHAAAADEAYYMAEQNATHMIWQLDDIFGYFNPQKEDIQSLFEELIPSFDYMFEKTPRLEVEISEIKLTNDELTIKTDISNLSDLLSTQNQIYLNSDLGYANGKSVDPDEKETIKFIIGNYNQGQEFAFEIGNEFTGFYSFRITGVIGTTSFILPALVAAAVVIIIILRFRP